METELFPTIIKATIVISYLRYILRNAASLKDLFARRVSGMTLLVFDYF